MSGVVEFEYTIEEGGKWHPAKGGIFRGPWHAHSTEHLEAKLESWAGEAESEVDPDRRVKMITSGGNLVECAAVRLGNGRVLDAILGCFRDDEEALEEIRGAIAAEAGEHDYRTAVQKYLDGDGPDPMPSVNFDDRLEDRFLFGVDTSADGDEMKTMEQQRREQIQETFRRAIQAAQEQAFDDAVEFLCEAGLLSGDPGEYGIAYDERTPTPVGPSDLKALINSGRLSTVTQTPATPAVFERGWICLDAPEAKEGEYIDFPPEGAIASWEIELPVRR